MHDVQSPMHKVPPYIISSQIHPSSTKMHGRPRKPQTEDEQQSSSLKASQLRNLQSQFLQFHHQNTFTNEAMEVSAKLLSVNPEHYSAWNYRKLAVEDKIKQLGEDFSSEQIKLILDVELKLVESALRRNYKSYGAWHHRKWVLSKGQSSTDHELLLLNQFQKADARNFHAWNYRRFITALKNIPNEEELQYTTDVIEDNFSNYSAWHNRSVILSELSEKKAEGYFPKKDVLIKEFDLVCNALFTDPDDQSGWFYHFWLIDQTTKAESLSVLSWPSHGSSIYVSRDGSSKNSDLPFCNYRSSARTFPVILCFSEPVKGVNSSTVTVKYEYGTSHDLTWTPLSTDIKQHAQAWITYLNFPEDNSPASKSYQVNVNHSHSEGIVSFSGINVCQSFDVSFTVHAPSYKSESAQGSNDERVSWHEESFYEEATEVQNYALHDFSHLTNVKQDERIGLSEWKLEIIASEINNCRELLSTVDCKIGKLTLARLLMAQHSLTSCGSVGGSSSTYYEEVLQLYDDLKNLDPSHSQYYKDNYSLVLLKQIMSDNRFLQKYCRRYRDSTSPSTDWCFCVRLNNLSLSRLGSVEQLLWVQMLDLSHNQLRAIEGLEAMQLLSSLNLSHNKLCSFTALEPLRLLKSLKVLDISYNEIGEHSIDSRRHLCSSPITHTTGSNWSFDQYVASDPQMTKYWDAYSIFKDVNLIQLDILGNAVADEKLKSFLRKLMPELKWLDSETLR